MATVYGIVKQSGGYIPAGDSEIVHSDPVAPAPAGQEP